MKFVKRLVCKIEIFFVKRSLKKLLSQFFKGLGKELQSGVVHNGNTLAVSGGYVNKTNNNFPGFGGPSRFPGFGQSIDQEEQSRPRILRASKIECTYCGSNCDVRIVDYKKGGIILTKHLCGECIDKLEEEEN